MQKLRNARQSDKMGQEEELVPRLEQSVETLNNVILRESYLNYAGLKKRQNTSAIYRRFYPLRSRKSLRAVTLLLRKSSGDERRRLEMLKAFLLQNSISYATRHLTDEIRSVEGSGYVNVLSKRIPFQLATALIYNIENREPRAKVYEAQNHFIEENLQPLLESRLIVLRKHVRNLGFTSFVHFCSVVKKINFHELVHTFESLFSRTATLFDTVVHDYVHETLGVEAPSAHDFAFLTRAKSFDRYFPRRKVRSLLTNTFLGLGIDLSKQKAIKIDLVPRPRKHFVGFMVPLQVPNDIRIVVSPHRGWATLRSLLHEIGHAEHYVNADPNLPVEYRYLGGNTTTEAFAYLFEHLALNRRWVREVLPRRQVDSFIKRQSVLQFIFLHRFFAKVVYEMELYRRGSHGMAKKYANILTSFTGFEYSPARFLFDIYDGFYSAEYLKAWILEAQLRKRLEEGFGRAWFRHCGVGDFLQRIWRNCQKYSEEELSEFLGFDEWDYHPLQDSLLEALSVAANAK